MYQLMKSATNAWIVRFNQCALFLRTRIPNLTNEWKESFKFERDGDEMGIENYGYGGLQIYVYMLMEVAEAYVWTCA